MTGRNRHRTVHFARTPVPSAEDHGWLRACDPTNGGITDDPALVTCGGCRNTVYYKDPELATILPIRGPRETAAARLWALALAWPVTQEADGTWICAARRPGIRDMRFASGWRYGLCGEPLRAFGSAMQLVKAVLAHTGETAHEGLPAGAAPAGTARILLELAHEA
jgi:hypothetical protein